MSSDLERLSALVPAPVRQRLGTSVALPLETGVLLDAAADAKQTLLAFAPPTSAIAAASSGILRAARERDGAVVLRVDLSDATAHSAEKTFEAVCLAADEARHRSPFALIAELRASVGQLSSGATGAAVAQALGAGFPGVLLEVVLPAPAEEIAEALAPLRATALGAVVALRGGDVQGRTQMLAKLKELQVPIVAVAGDVELARSIGARRWGPAEPTERRDFRPAVAQVALHLPPSARGERAEALAYFAAEKAIATWDAEFSAGLVIKALLNRWS